MVVHRVAAQPQPQRLPVDLGHDLQGHRRIAQQCLRQAGAVERAAFEHQGGVEASPRRRRRGIEHVHVHAQLRAGFAEAPGIGVRHRHERRDVEALGEAPGVRGAVTARLGHRQHVGVALPPRRVGDLGHDAVQALLRVVAVVERDRIEAMAEVAQVGEHAHRAQRTLAGVLLHAVAHRFVQRLRGVAQVVAAAELGQVAPVHRPQPAPREYLLQFVQVQVQQEQRVAERQRFRRVTAMPHPAGVHRAVQAMQGRARRRRRCRDGASRRGGHGSTAHQRHDQGTPSAAATSTALRRPSSWKPKPQPAPANQVLRWPWISPLRACAATDAWVCSGCR
ncbi:hypothetical protein NB689_003454 [Xanthomonas sacchari]|nr:hypothetical protein [Xanthomonas sacchari]